MRRRTFVAALGLATMLAAPIFAGIAAAAALEDITSRGTIRVAVPQDFPPFGSVGTDMTPSGYDIDMAMLIGEKLGVDVEIVPVTSANRIPYLQTRPDWTKGPYGLILDLVGPRGPGPGHKEHETMLESCSFGIVHRF